MRTPKKKRQNKNRSRRSSDIMNRLSARMIGSESNKYKRWIAEATEIRKRTINRDEGAFLLRHT